MISIYNPESTCGQRDPPARDNVRRAKGASLLAISLPRLVV